MCFWPFALKCLYILYQFSPKMSYLCPKMSLYTLLTKRYLNILLTQKYFVAFWKTKVWRVVGWLETKKTKSFAF